MAGMVATLDFFTSLYVGSCETLCFSVQIQSPSQTIERTEEAITGASTETLEKVWENINFRIDHIIRVNGGLVEQHNI